jgi:hypothetical protein
MVTAGPSVRESIAGPSAVASALLLLAGVVLLLQRVPRARRDT